MFSRDRVLLALNHKEPDRVPVAPPRGMVNINDAVKHFIETFDFDQFVSLDFTKDFKERHISGSSLNRLSEDKFVDKYGCIFKDMGVANIPYCIHNPLGNVKKPDDVDRFPKWPDPNDIALIQNDARERAKQLHEKKDYVTIVHVPMIFHRYVWMRGFNKWLIDMKTSSELYKAIADRIYNINLTSTLRLLNEVGDYTDLVELNDDMGTTQGPFMSVEDFKKFVKPYYKNLIGRIEKEFHNVKFWLHSHGNITKLLPDIIDSGIDTLNPILPGDNMDPYTLKERYSSQLSFDGGVDVERIIPFGTVSEVKEHIKKVIDILAPGGGYIFRVQMISNVVPNENLYAAYETALEYGAY
jgi:uroporphyrinogen decarboxylase